MYTDNPNAISTQDIQRVRILVAGAIAAVSQNAVFPADVNAAIQFLTEVKDVLTSIPGRVMCVSLKDK